MLPRAVPLLSKLHSRIRATDLPQYERGLSRHKLAIYQEPLMGRFRSIRAAHLRMLRGLYDVSVRSLVCSAKMWPTGTIRLALTLTFAGFLPTVSHPPAVALASHQSPNQQVACCQLENSHYDAGDFHPQAHAPSGAYRTLARTVRPRSVVIAACVRSIRPIRSCWGRSATENS